MARQLNVRAARDALLEYLARQAWQPRPGLVTWVLLPLAGLYLLLSSAHRLWWRWVREPQRAPVPVVVVGNLVVGGSGKTPVVISLVQALQAAGRRPGVISRGHGGSVQEARPVAPDSDAAAVGDEPLLIRRRCAVPVWVARRRIEAARALCAAHPEVDVLVADDGLQHWELARDAQLVVFDARGAGNGLPLPAGPLRQPLPARLPPRTAVLYNAAAPSTPLPGTPLAATADRVWPLDDWQRGAAEGAQPLAHLRGRALAALAGIGAPQKFFAVLEAAGLQFERCPQPDHVRYHHAPWPAGTREVVTTEKDAVKLTAQLVGATPVWVLRLDLALPADLVRRLLQWLPARPA